MKIGVDGVERAASKGRQLGDGPFSRDGFGRLGTRPSVLQIDPAGVSAV